MSKLGIIVALTLSLLSGALYADLKTIDRGSSSWPSDKGYWLIFVARDSVPGHAYVVWGIRNRKTNKWNSLFGFGKYPINSAKVAFGTIPGKIVKESTSSLNSANNGLAVGVTKQMYDYALTNTNAIRSSTVPYNLIDKSCVDFTELVARAIGLNSSEPTGLENHPQEFINKLKKSNS